MKIQRIDHVGVVVDDLPAAKAFFLDFGLEVLGEGEGKGELLDQVVGLKDAKTAFVMLGTPDGQAHIELVKFYTPSDEKGIQQSFANTLVNVKGILAHPHFRYCWQTFFEIHIA
jgi:catechol 2,3-dioxygenase-like lactoylglutathione lyase family enzyme